MFEFIFFSLLILALNSVELMRIDLHAGESAQLTKIRVRIITDIVFILSSTYQILLPMSR